MPMVNVAFHVARIHMAPSPGTSEMKVIAFAARRPVATAFGTERGKAASVWT